MDNKENNDLNYNFNFELRPSTKDKVEDSSKENNTETQKPVGYQPPKQQSLAEIAAEAREEAEQHKQFFSNINNNDLPISHKNNIQKTVQTNNQNNTVNGVEESKPEQNVSAAPVNSIRNEDDELIKAFIGPNYETITTNKFNFAAAFLGFPYMFYRKMMLYGFLSILVMPTLSALVTNVFAKILNVVKLSDSASLIVLLIANAATYILVYGSLTNRLYLSFVKHKVYKIKLENSNKDYEYIKNICIRKGGRSAGRFLLGLLIPIIMAIVMVVAIFASFGLFVGNLFNAFNSNNNTQNAEYNGILIQDNSIKIADEFTITVPERFENDSNDYEYSYSYDNKESTEVFSDCKVSLYKVANYSSSENLISQMAKQNQINKQNINNTTWSWFKETNTFGDAYIYSTEKDGSVYLLEYEKQEGADAECIAYKDQILNSIYSK